MTIAAVVHNQSMLRWWFAIMALQWIARDGTDSHACMPRDVESSGFAPFIPALRGFPPLLLQIATLLF